MSTKNRIASLALLSEKGQGTGVGLSSGEFHGTTGVFAWTGGDKIVWPQDVCDWIADNGYGVEGSQVLALPSQDSGEGNPVGSREGFEPTPGLSRSGFLVKSLLFEPAAGTDARTLAIRASLAFPPYAQAWVGRSIVAARLGIAYLEKEIVDSDTHFSEAYHKIVEWKRKGSRRRQ